MTANPSIQRTAFGTAELKRWDHWIVLLGCIGAAVALLAMNVFAIWELARGPARADAGLIKLGIAIGTLFVGYYAYAAYRFFRVRRVAA